MNSASYSAGSRLSRTKAIASIPKETMNSMLQEHGISLSGAGLDEAPGACKDIRQVITAQQDLPEVTASFQPAIVRMANEGSRED